MKRSLFYAIIFGALLASLGCACKKCRPSGGGGGSRGAGAPRLGNNNQGNHNDLGNNDLQTPQDFFNNGNDFQNGIENGEGVDNEEAPFPTEDDPLNLEKPDANKQSTDPAPYRKPSDRLVGFPDLLKGIEPAPQRKLASEVPFKTIENTDFLSLGNFSAEMDANGKPQLFVNFPFDLEAANPRSIQPGSILAIQDKADGNEGLSLFYEDKGKKRVFFAATDGSRRHVPTDLLPSADLEELAKTPMNEQLRKAGFAEDKTHKSVYRKKVGKDVEFVAILAGNRLVKILRSVKPEIQQAANAAKLIKQGEEANSSSAFGEKVSVLTFEDKNKKFKIIGPRIDGDTGTVVHGD